MLVVGKKETIFYVKREKVFTVSFKNETGIRTVKGSDPDVYPIKTLLTISLSE